jgi:uncharacterized protein YigE (DUF2233 family)
MRRQAVAYCKHFLVSALFLCSLFSAIPAHAADWSEIAPGLEYIDIGANLLTPWSHIHAFRIDLNQNQLNVVMAKKLSKKYASVEEFAGHSNALLAINGGFFDHDYRPLGLRINNQRQYNPLKHISWWGVFYIKNKQPYLSSVRKFNNHQKIDFAVQSGPRLLVNGRIPALKIGHAERSALGISPDGRVIILVTENMPMTTRTLAELMKASPLNCKDALNLDGGNSSQLFAQTGFFKINAHGFSNVSDAIVVKPRKNRG